MNIDVYLKPAEAADYLRSSASTLAKARRSGLGPTFVRIGRSVRYRRADLDSWMAESAQTAVSNFQAITTGPKRHRPQSTRLAPKHCAKIAKAGTQQ
jgi:excisionase family DNA binding protein